jgi:molybdenum cofactor cytidylyltransferase
MEMKNDSYGIILVAAGASRRMGKPKQGLLFNGKTLVRIASETALGTGCRLIVVTGASAGLVEKNLDGLDLRLVYNPEWESGMASSIRTGIEQLQDLPGEWRGAMMILCDQPFITSGHLLELIRTKEENAALIVASEYNGTLGSPVLFDATLFGELLLLSGDSGGKSILKKYAEDVFSVPFPEGAYDVDTEKDYELLLKNEHDQG